VTSQHGPPDRWLDVAVQPFEQVVADHGPTVLRVCRALLGPTAADDAWSDTFLAAMRAYPDLRPDSDVRAWLVTIAHRKSIDHLRRDGRAPRATGAVPERPSPEGIPGPPDDDLRAAVAGLAPKQQAAVVYRYLADLSYRDVAALLECSEAAARRNAADGIAVLRRTYHPTGRPTDGPAGRPGDGATDGPTLSSQDGSPSNASGGTP
jgi:RNA polymerase sigma factor (sigma-70 family)